MSLRFAPFFPFSHGGRTLRLAVRPLHWFSARTRPAISFSTHRTVLFRFGIMRPTRRLFLRGASRSFAILWSSRRQLSCARSRSREFGLTQTFLQSRRE